MSAARTTFSDPCSTPVARTGASPRGTIEDLERLRDDALRGGGAERVESQHRRGKTGSSPATARSTAARSSFSARTSP